MDRVEEGNFGTRRWVGEGVWELKIHQGPGYRVYFGLDGNEIVVLLCGGDKRPQDQDIKIAHDYWADHLGRRPLKRK
jgi:putative addiction module killer protein